MLLFHAMTLCSKYVLLFDIHTFAASVNLSFTSDLLLLLLLLSLL